MTEEKLGSYVRSGSAMLHPETCASSIRWSVVVKERRHEYEGKVHYHRQFGADVHLTDCSRQITWGTDHSERGAGMLEKLDRAIAELQAARAAVVEGEAFYQTLRHGKDEDE